MVQWRPIWHNCSNLIFITHVNLGSPFRAVRYTFCVRSVSHIFAVLVERIGVQWSKPNRRPPRAGPPCEYGCTEPLVKWLSREQI
jgi:hypothetical protein